ncbi:MAG: hypothetical protein U1F65_10045 [Verrucomicrobiota bacterium]
MKTIIVNIPKAGSKIELCLAQGKTSGQAVLVLGDDVELKQTDATSRETSVEQVQTHNGFPPRSLTKQTIVQILREHGGSVRIRDTETGWNIYDELAARLGVSVEARRRLTEGTGEPAWRPEVGFCRKDLEQAAILAPTEVSGRGIWTLKKI